MQFHVLSFEGPDPYACAGGIASRVSGLTEALSATGQEVHLWFVGDPELPGHERRGSLHLHRWCQWISRYHREGVYAGEEGKRGDYVHSLPPRLLDDVLRPHLTEGGRSVVLAEEWHTADAVIHLDGLLRAAGLRERVTLLWNANNTFGFHRVDWRRLARAAVITTVSRYMKHLMWDLGVDPVVIPNGISVDALTPPQAKEVAALRQRVEGRCLLSKVARWDPDKRWLLAVECVRALKQRGLRPLLIARGGVESHGAEVRQAARQRGLELLDVTNDCPGGAGLVAALGAPNGADIVSLSRPLDPAARQVLFKASHAVLANSGHEPFGLVGLEAMAAGGVACTGCTGEDYAVAGHNAVVLETNEPQEFVSLFEDLHTHPEAEKALRRAARATARRYTWPEVIHRVLLPRLSILAEGTNGPSQQRANLDGGRIPHAFAA